MEQSTLYWIFYSLDSVPAENFTTSSFLQIFLQIIGLFQTRYVFMILINQIKQIIDYKNSYKKGQMKNLI